MSSLPYLEIATPLIKYAVILTLLTNSLLIHLTSNVIKSITPAYKFLINVEAILGIVFSLVEILVHPFLHSYNASFVYFSSSPATSSSMILRVVLLIVYSLTYMVIICCLSIQFIYRYFVVASRESLIWFKGCRVIFWIFYGLISSVLWVIGLCLFFPDGYSREYVAREMERQYDMDVHQLASFQLVAYDEEGNLRTMNCLGLSSLTVILGILYMIVVYFGLKTHFSLKAIISMTSAKTHRLHTQLFKTLVLQITVPTIFYNSPVFLMYLSPYLDWKFSFPSGLMICCFNFYPATDSWILMWMVTEYQQVIRKAVESWLKRILSLVMMKSEGNTSTDRPAHELEMEVVRP